MIVAKFEPREHLYRRHRSTHCPRCWEEFDEDDDLAYHLRTRPQHCLERDKPELNGFDSTQEIQLRSRTGVPFDEEERWRHVYRILFPHDDHDNMPSPCESIKVQLLLASRDT